MKKLKSGRVYLDATGIDGEYLKKRFTGIYEGCLKRGLDITKDQLPVKPAQHYFMGGLAVDSYGKTSCKNLYAVGEVSCTGLHGKNRLASNSLLEALVYSGRAAEDIEKNIRKTPGKKEEKQAEEVLGKKAHKMMKNCLHWNYRKEAVKILIGERGDLRDELSIS